MLLHTCLVRATPGWAFTHAITTTIPDGLCGSNCGNAHHFPGPGHGHGSKSVSHQSRQPLRRVAISHGFRGLWEEPTLVWSRRAKHRLATSKCPSHVADRGPGG